MDEMFKRCESRDLPKGLASQHYYELYNTKKAEEYYQKIIKKRLPTLILIHGADAAVFPIEFSVFLNTMTQLAELKDNPLLRIKGETVRKFPMFDEAIAEIKRRYRIDE